MASVPVQVNTIPFFTPSCQDSLDGFKKALGSPATLIKGASLFGSFATWGPLLNVTIPDRLVPMLKGAGKAGSGLVPMFFLRQTFVLGNELYSNAFNLKSRKVVDATAEWVRDASNLGMLVLKNVYFGLSAAVCDIIHETISFVNARLDLERADQTVENLRKKGLHPSSVRIQLEACCFLAMVKSIASIAGAALKIFAVVYGTQCLVAALALSAASKIFAILAVFHKEMSHESIYKRALVANLEPCPTMPMLALA